MKYIKQNKFFFAIISICLTLLNSSCDNYFDKVTSDKVRTEDHYKTFIDLQISQVGVFTLLQEVAPNLILISELMSDMTTLNTSANQYLTEINEHEPTAGNPYLNTEGFYKIIIAANEVIEQLNSIKKNIDLSTVDKETVANYDRLFAYLVVLKSWCYLTLVKLHGEAAYIEHNITSLPENMDLTYLNRNQMLDVLISDLDTLSDINNKDFSYIIDDDETSSTYNNVLMQVININAIIGEIYLEKQDYIKAEEHLIKACNELDDRWHLTSAYDKDSWAFIFQNNSFGSNLNEIMLKVAYDLSEGQENILEKWIGPDRDFLIKPTDNIINLFNSQKDGDEYRGLNVSYGLTVETQTPYINKYSLGEKGGAHIILYRTADIVLMLAEAVNRNGQSQVALNLVNQGETAYIKGWKKTVGIRYRADLPDVTCEPLTVDCVEDIIMNERALELAFEGKRWFDLMRVARRRGDVSYLANKVAAKFSNPATSDKVRNLLLSEKNWYLPFEK